MNEKDSKNQLAEAINPQKLINLDNLYICIKCSIIFYTIFTKETKCPRCENGQ